MNKCMNNRTMNRISLGVSMFLLLCLLVLVGSCADVSTPLPTKTTAIGLEPTENNLFEDTSVELSQQVTVDPKASTIIDDPNATDGKAAALYRTGDGVRFELKNVQSGTYKVSVWARGQLYRGPPILRLKVGGQQVGRDNVVKSSTYKEQRFGEVTLERGQVLEAVFTNDKWGGTPETDRNVYIDYLVLTRLDTAKPPPGKSTYRQNLRKIKAASVRNTNEDDSRFLNTPMAALPVNELLGPRSDYKKYGEHYPNGFDNVGSFRTTCEFSHFAYDDPIVYPGQPEVAHLHMFFGNTDVNAHSTFDTLFNSGGGTCNGFELNRTGYWAPAMFDTQGNVRVPNDIYVYYKGYGEAMKRGEVATYPEELAIVSDPRANAQDEGGFAFKCISEYGGDIHNESPTIPVCRGGVYKDGGKGRLEMNIKFQQCWNGRDPGNYQDNLSVPEYSWFSGICPDSHPVALPNLRVRIVYDVAAGENTSGWYLSSDVDPGTLKLKGPRGRTFHSDWWGGWHPDINQEWIDNCTNVNGAGCGSGYLSDGGNDPDNVKPGRALKLREQYEGPFKVPAATLFEELCTVNRTINSPEEAAYCRPGAGLAAQGALHTH